MQDYRRLLLPLLAVIASTAAAESRAQDGERIDEIQVTATRRPLSSSSVSAALTVVDGDEINSRKLVTDALASQPGVYLQQTTSGQGAAIIRGLKGSEILHLVDGLRLNNAIFRNAPTQYLALVPPGSVERMEIVRGSPTSLYGSDAVGGVIQVISRLPRFDSDEVRLRREVAIAADTAELGKSVQVSLDAGNRRVAGLVSVAHQSIGDRRTGSGERIHPSAYDSSSARAAIVLRPDARRSWVLDWQFTRQPKTPRVDELVPGFGQTEPASAEFFFEPNERHFVHLRHRRDDGALGADWTVDLGWQRIVDDHRNRNFGETERHLEENRSDLFGLSVTAARDIGAASWVFGAEAYHDTVRSSRLSQAVTGGATNVEQARFPDGATVAQGGVFAHLAQPLGERHTLSGGVRLSRVDIELPATALSPAADLAIDDVSADVGWLTNLTDTLQFVANVGHGFRAPNVFDLGTLGERPGNRFNIPNPSLVSERVTQYDLGLRQQRTAWAFDLVVYRLHYADRIQSALTGDTTVDGRDVVQNRNLGSADIDGIEAGLRWQPAGSFNAELVVNRTRGEQREADGSTVPGDRIPPLFGHLGLEYALTDRLEVTASLRYAARQDRLSPRDVRDSRIDPDGTPGWVSVDAGVRWHAGDTWQVDAGIDNVLDRRYRAHGSGLDAPGRSLYVAARARW